MKILFSMRHLGFVRNFETVLCLLAERGHEVQVVSDGGGTESDWDFARQLADRYRSLTFASVRREPFVWRELAQRLRAGLDYLHYLHPAYYHAPKLRKRVEQRAPASIVRLSRLPGLRSRLGVRAITATLTASERAIPSNREVERLMARTQPDVVLATPLVLFASPQVDYLRSAKARGIRTALCVGRWDTFTTKGAVYEMPDLVTVWNHQQRDEAITLHGVPPGRVAVTGAHPYDHWFEWRASPREEFCDRVGLAPVKPFLLYACSSRFVAPNEAEFVRTWIDHVRVSNHAELRDAGILIRPHPENAQTWDAIELSRLDNVVVWPREATTPLERGAKADYFDSLYHSAAVIGLNTSAFIEAAIIGRPVYTMLTPEYADVQEGTIHFHYLLETNGGILQVSADMATHLEQLASACVARRERASRDDTFIETFVRPHGCHVPSALRLVEAIEHVAQGTARRAARPPLWIHAWRVMLFPLAAFSELTFLIAKPRTNGKDAAAYAGAFSRLLLHPKTGLLRLSKVRAVAARLMDAAFRLDAFRNFTLRHLVPRAMPATRATTPPGETPGKTPHEARYSAAESNARHLATRSLARLSDSTTPILVGPWLGEVGFEVLYWIPFLRWAKQSAGLETDRLIAVSRGGTADWYQGICGTYQDVFDYCSHEESHGRAVKRAGLHQKQEAMGELDRDIMERVRRSLGIGECETLHPSLMYELFFPFWRKQASIGLLETLTAYRLFPGVNTADLDGRLPDDYVAVKLYANDSFPNVGANRRIVERIVGRLTEQTNVLLLDTGLQLDDHRPFSIADRKRLMRVADWSISPRNNLAVQTQIVSRAKAFVGTLGGFSFLAPLCGVDSVALYSHPTHMRPHHLDVARRVFSTLNGGAFVPIDTAHIDLLQDVFGREQPRPFAVGPARSSTRQVVLDDCGWRMR